jgi:hypothetical protein
MKRVKQSLRSIFSRKPRVNKIETQKPTPKVKEKKKSRKPNKAGRKYDLKGNGKRKYKDLYASGGCRTRGGARINWEEHSKNMGIPRHKIKYARLELPEGIS